MVDNRFPEILRRSSVSRFPVRADRLRHLEWALVGIAAGTAVVRHGLNHDGAHEHLELGVLPFLGLLCTAASLITRYRWSLTRVSFRRSHLVAGGLLTVWATGLILILIGGPRLDDWISPGLTRWPAIVWWSEVTAGLLSAVGLVQAVRTSTAMVRSPALLLVISFAVLITVGTVLLMLPRSRHQLSPDEQISAPLSVALFTATSASCVTGLIVVPTGSYWSPFGQTIILLLFQTGGLGIMTWGALFAILAGQRMGLREAVTFGEMLESENLLHVRRLLFSIFAFTLSIELLGAVALSGLWSDLPPGERAFQSLFHSVSAFCNAGFSLQDDGFLGMGTRWQVWGPLTMLIITGGLGFGVMHNLASVAGQAARRWRVRRRNRLLLLSSHSQFGQRSLPLDPPRLSLTSQLSLVASLVLLFIGAVGFFLLESTAPELDQPIGQRLADAWFQSVTFRTAGFNTVDHGQMQTGTKFFAIPLMFIGASPGSTGGGVKTISFALLALTIFSILRGHERIEIRHRTLAVEQVNRALAVIAIGMVIVLTVTLLLVLFERQPDRFLDHLYEATSALATVGVSTGVTPELSPPSRVLIVFTMFVGRIGPLTMLIALARTGSQQDYHYPVERVALG